MSIEVQAASLKLPRKFLLLFCGIIFALNSLILKPVYIIVSSDIILANSLLLTLLESLMLLCDISAFSSAFAAIIYSVFFRKNAKLADLILTYSLLVFARVLVDIVMTAIVNHAIDFTDIWSVLFYIVLETLQLSVVLVLAKRQLKKAPLADNSLNIKKLFSETTPIKRSALHGAILLSAIKIATRIVFDVFYGLPESIVEVASMVLFYTADILIILLAYIAIMLVIRTIHKKDI